MRLLLHAGMSKAGSSALQRALRRAHPSLLRKGVLYPLTYRGNHNFLMAGVVGFDRLPRRYRQEYSGRRDQLERDFQKFWNGVLSQIERYRPRTIVLSGEALYCPLSAAEIDRLHSFLRPLADRFEVAIYARRPSEFYLSDLQRTLKASLEIKPIGGVEYRPNIAPYLEIADALHVVPFARDQLHRHDVVLDFAKRFLPECFGELEATATGLVNETVSAEAMSILCSYRRDIHSQRNDIHTWDTTKLFNLLRQTEREAGLFERPRLRQEIRDAVDRLSTDLVWLRESFGITFEGVSPSLAQAGATLAEPQDVEAVCEVDPHKRDRLLMLALSRLLTERERSDPVRLIKPWLNWVQLNRPEFYFKLGRILRRR